MMKKYLMSGVAALALCAAFTSCSKNENLYDENRRANDVISSYNDAFIKTFGQPAANQDWGFGSRANTRTADPRGNMWAAEGWNVPPVITDAQKDIVRRYFQQNTPLGYNDPEWSDFWIQQVYKGGTKTTDGSQTTEKYIIGNDDEVTGGNHMDHLCSKSENGTEDHVNDFNNADNNDWEGRMLMVGSSTYSFGYINSNATAIHYDKAALVNWRVIAQWAVDKGLESSVESSVLNDGWNRSYMGFDWEQALPDDCYAKGVSRPDENGNWQYYPDEYNTFEFEGKTYRFLSANSNQYAYDQNEPTFGGKKNYNDRPSDDIIRQLLSLGYLPYSDTLKDWIKLSTGSDGYYSDWIVTLTKAETTSTPPTPQPGTLTESLRVIAEDLTVDQNTDFDFNDVVFDVTWSRTVDANNNISNSVVTITLKAAGGTLPLYVDGKEVHQLYQENNMTLFINQYTMINTHAEALSLSGISDLADITWTTTNYTGSTIEDIANSIDVMVKKNGQEIHLAAPVGGIASKIGVKTDYEWCNERQDIEEKYKLIDNTSPFREWVRGIYPAQDWYSYAKDEIDKYKANKIAAQAGN